MSRYTEFNAVIGMAELRFEAGNGALLDSFKEMMLRYNVAQHTNSDKTQYQMVLTDHDARAFLIDFMEPVIRTVGIHATSFLTYLINEEYEINHDEMHARIEIRIYL